MLQNLRYGVRTLLRLPGFATLAVLTPSAMALVAVLCLGIAQIACVRCRLHGPPPPEKPAMATRSDFEDLQPGMVRVVVPMLKSGGYVLPSLQSQTTGNTLELATGDDFLGYEKAYYKITRRTDGGVRIRFSHAEVWEKGKMHKHNRPLLDLFSEAAGARHIRLVYLTRVSRADHNTAIVASDDPAALSQVTQMVTRDAECHSSEKASCRWVPNGIAVTPERDSSEAARRRTENGEQGR